ncbi:HNH endonuclease signature motif containing protein [Dietzia psychralcaliphila]|uniref:HNH endonuclease signature motif containing protein n=1 Tax=Dietzia psychralcaliphila TaxID=139021 RepID=UPI001C1E6747|nr:HNH endonuclease signature motif containing protein [Dietzia psychralcaliphila]
MTSTQRPISDNVDAPEAPIPPPGFTTSSGPALPVLVPDAFARWDPGQQRGYLAQRTIYAAEGRTLAYAYDCVRSATDRYATDRSATDRFATEHDRHRDPWETAATMISASMALSRPGASRLVTTAVELTERLPRTAALLATGWIGILAAHTIAEETALVADHLMPELDRQISDGLAPTRRRTHPPRLGPLRKMLTKTIAACDPVGADARAQQARRDQDVELVPLQDDRAIITATLTAEDALEIADRIEAFARTASPDDPRPLGQLRAAGLLALSRGWTSLPDPDGEHPTDPEARSSARRVVIHAYDDGTPDNRGLTLAGYGPITGHTAEELQRSARLRIDSLSELADPDTTAARRHAPSEAVSRFCRGRDGTCVFPGCQTSAEKADLDHIIPFDHDHPDRGGHTTCDDLGSLCRFHHRLKTDGVWAYYRDTDGSYVWLHGPNHPDRDPGTRIWTFPSGPLAGHAAPQHPEASSRQREAAEAGETGSGSAESRRRPHMRHRREAERQKLRAQARLRRQTERTGPRATQTSSSPASDDEPPF